MTRTALTLLLLALAVPALAVPADTEPLAVLELAEGEIESPRHLVPDEVSWSFLTPLPEEGGFDVPGGAVRVAHEKGTAELTWKNPRGRDAKKRVRVTPRGAKVRLPKMGRDGADFELVLLAHPRLQTPFRIGAATREAEFAGKRIVLLDGDADGVYGERGEDLVLVCGRLTGDLYPMMATIPVGTHLVRPELREDGRLALTPWETKAGPEIAETLARVNALRVAAGLPECELDDAFSEACRKHCRYLDLNGIASGSGVTHDEDPALPGYTEEGARAAGRSMIGTGDEDMRVFLGKILSQFFHRTPLLRPGTWRLGMAHAHGGNMIDTASGRRHAAFDRPIPFPIAGQYGAPRVYEPEWPEFEGSGRGAGVPITLLLPEGAGAVTDLRVRVALAASGERIRGRTLSPEKPAHPRYPENQGCLAFVPETALLPLTRYDVRMTWKEGGEEREFAWHFVTGR